MDPTKKARRSPADYLAQATNPAAGAVRKAQQGFAKFTTAPGTTVPNNTEVVEGMRQELESEQHEVLSNTYRDWRRQGRPQNPELVIAQPTAPMAHLAGGHWDQPQMLADGRWAGLVAGEGHSGEPVDPLGLIKSPGVAAAPRLPGSHQPGVLPMPAGDPMALEDLRFVQSPMSAYRDLEAPSPGMASRTEGAPGQARLPKPPSDAKG